MKKLVSGGNYRRPSTLPFLESPGLGRPANTREDPTCQLSCCPSIGRIRVFARSKKPTKRAQAGRELAKKVGVEIKQLFLTSGDSDVLLIVDAPDGDNVAKFALSLGSLGNVRTRLTRLWPEADFQKLISELP